MFTDRASAEAAFASRRLRVPDLVLVAAPSNFIVTTLTKAHELAKNRPLFDVPSHAAGSLKLYLCSVTAPIANMEWNPRPDPRRALADDDFLHSRLPARTRGQDARVGPPH
jgi:hypothetical protein